MSVVFAYIIVCNNKGNYISILLKRKFSLSLCNRIHDWSPVNIYHIERVQFLFPTDHDSYSLWKRQEIEASLMKNRDSSLSCGSASTNDSTSTSTPLLTTKTPYLAISLIISHPITFSVATSGHACQYHIFRPSLCSISNIHVQTHSHRENCRCILWNLQAMVEIMSMLTLALRQIMAAMPLTTSKMKKREAVRICLFPTYILHTRNWSNALAHRLRTCLNWLNIEYITSNAHVAACSLEYTGHCGDKTNPYPSVTTTNHGCNTSLTLQDLTSNNSNLLV